MARRSSTNHSNLLLGLAWLGELDRTQIARLWLSDKSESSIEKTITQLRKDGLIQARKWSLRDKKRNVTVPQLDRWSLTPEGHALVVHSDQYPFKPHRPRQLRLIKHDARTAEIIVQLILLARPAGLSGLYIAHEVRLNAALSRPRCDALVVMQLGTFDTPNVVPWSSDGAIEDEERLRFAIEADNNSEPLEVIRGKARAYATLYADQEWRRAWQRVYGPLPIPLWAAPTAERAERIHQQWQRVWVQGTWLLTDDVALKEQRWHWSNRQAHERMLRLSGKAPTLPPPPAALPAPAPAPPAALPAPSPATLAPSTEAQAQISSAPTSSSATSAVPATPSAVSHAAATLATPIAPAATPGVQTLPPRYIPPPVRAPTEADYARAKPARDRWLWLVSLGWVVWFFLLALWWLLRLPVRLVLTVWGWYSELGYETHQALVRASAVVLLVGLLWCVLVQPSWFTGSLGSAWHWLGATLVTEAPRPTVQLATLAPTARASATAAQTPNCGRARITAKGVKLRRMPGVNAPLVRTLRAGEQVTLWCEAATASDQYTWYHLRTADGSEGWAASAWVQRE